MSIAGLITAFAVIIILVMRKIPIGWSLIMGTIIIGITSLMGVSQYLSVFWRGLTNPDTLELTAIIALISIMSYLMNETGMIEKLLDSIQVLFKDPRLSLILIPSLMGSLPVPGGAMLSAPMVKNVGHQMDLSRERKMAVNLVYRHIWYFIFPFEPTLILAAKLAGINLLTLILWQIPMTLVIGVIGFYIYFRQGFNKQSDFAVRVQSRGLIEPLKQFLFNGLPLILAIIVAFIFNLNFWLGLIAGIIYIIVIKFRELPENIFFQGIDFALLLTILGIMVFKEFVNYGDTLQQLANILVAIGIPPMILAVILPGAISFFTGSRPAAIGITYPLLAGIFGRIGLTEAIIIFGSGFFFYLISPIHVCFTLTQAFFDVDYRSIYNELAWPLSSGIVTLLILGLLT